MGKINPAHETFSDTRKVPPTLLTGVTPDMRIMQDEIFGPLLPIMEYDQIDDVIEFINSRPRPLALYYFDFDQARADYVAQRTHSGHFGQKHGFDSCRTRRFTIWWRWCIRYGEISWSRRFLQFVA